MEGGGVPASHVLGQTSAYWHHVPSASAHAVPFVGWLSGQPLLAVVPPSGAQSPPSAVHVPLLHATDWGSTSPPGQSVEPGHDFPSSAAVHAAPGRGRAQHWPSQLGAPPPVLPGSGAVPASPPSMAREPESPGPFPPSDDVASATDEQAAVNPRSIAGTSARRSMRATEHGAYHALVVRVGEKKRSKAPDHVVAPGTRWHSRFTPTRC